MTVPPASVAVGVSLAAVVASGLFLALVLQHRDDPTSRAIIAIAASLFLGAIVHLLLVEFAAISDGILGGWRPTFGPGGVWVLLAFGLPAMVSGFWFLFALQYTGRDRDTTPVAYAIVGFLVVGLLVSTLGFALLESIGQLPPGALNVLLGLTLVLAESIALIGVFLLIATTIQHKAVPVGQTILLTSAVLAMLALPFVATTLQVRIATPIAISVSALLCTATVSGYRLFETLPVASVVSRNRVIEEMAEGVVLIDDDGRVLDMNPAAQRLLETPHAEVVDGRLQDVLPAFPEITSIPADDRVDVHLQTDRTLSVTADVLTDDRGRNLGHLLVCRDVTAQRREEHRVGVLTQVLAGAIQSEMDTLAATTADIGTGAPTEEQPGKQIHRTATDLLTLVSRVRTVEDALAERSIEGTHTTDVLETLDSLEVSHDLEATDRFREEPLPVTADRDLLAATLDILLIGTTRSEVPPVVCVRTDSDTVDIEIHSLPSPPRNSISDSALEIAELVTTSTDWHLEVRTDAGTSVVSLTVPVVREHTSRGGGGR